jgi:hypothetical protein
MKRLLCTLAIIFLSTQCFEANAQSLSKQNEDKSSAGGPPTREQLIGFWKMVEWPNPKSQKVNPWPLPFQWFAFYEDGRFVSMMNSKDEQTTAAQLNEVFSLFEANKTPKFNHLGQFIEITNPDIEGYKEVWGINIFTRDVGEFVKKGDIVMSLAGQDGSAIYYRLLRRIE